MWRHVQSPAVQLRPASGSPSMKRIRRVFSQRTRNSSLNALPVPMGTQIAVSQVLFFFAILDQKLKVVLSPCMIVEVLLAMLNFSFQNFRTCSFVVGLMKTWLCTLQRLLPCPLQMEIHLKLALQCLICHHTSITTLQCGTMTANQSSAVVVIQVLITPFASRIQVAIGQTWEVFCSIQDYGLVQHS